MERLIVSTSEYSTRRRTRGRAVKGKKGREIAGTKKEEKKKSEE